MTDQELRALVRDAVQRHLGSRAAALEPAPPAPPPSSVVFHPSHYKYVLVNAGDACVIEPGVTCNHCGYCKSHGH